MNVLAYRYSHVPNKLRKKVNQEIFKLINGSPSEGVFWIPETPPLEDSVVYWGLARIEVPGEMVKSFCLMTYADYWSIPFYDTVNRNNREDFTGNQQP